MGEILQALSQYWAGVVDYFAIDPSRLMEPDMLARLCLQVMLLCGSAFFSGSETSLFSLSRLDLQKLRRDRNRHSETLHALLDQPRRLIISILCGNELINIAASVNMTGILFILYGSDRVELINTLVMVPLLLLFGEVTPKTIAVSNPVRISANIVAAPMSLWVRFVAPLRWLIRTVSDRVTTFIVGEETGAENILQVDEFRTLLEDADEAELNATERALIYNLLEAGDTEIVEMMIPRTRTNFINADRKMPQIIEQFNTIRHARVPVYKGHRDNLIGFIHAEEVLSRHLKGVDIATLKLKDIMHPPVVVPLTKKVDEMFDFFQANNARAAAVLNEFGGVEGFITVADVLTFIFGDISGDVLGQEHYRERDENVYEVPGDMKLNDFNNLTNFGIEDPRMTTIGGVAFRHLDRLPKLGDRVTVEGIVITIIEMEGHRIAKVRVFPRIQEDEEQEQESAKAKQVTKPEPEVSEPEVLSVQNEAQTEDVTESEPAAQAEPEAETATEIETKPESVAEAEESESEAQAEEDEIEAGAQPEIEAEEVETEIESAETEVEAEIEVAETEVEAEIEAVETEAEAEVEEDEGETEIAPEPMAEIEAEAETEAEAEVEESETEVEEVETGAEEVETGAEEVETGAEEVETGTEEVKTGAEESETGAEESETGAEEGETGAEESASDQQRTEKDGSTEAVIDEVMEESEPAIEPAEKSRKTDAEV